MKDKTYYSFVSRHSYKGNDPAYYNAEEYSWASEIESAFPVMQKELAKLLTQDVLSPYKNGQLVENENDWKTVSIKAWGMVSFKRAKALPETMKVFSKIPGFVSLSFNLLKAGSEIAPHHGDTSATIRGHLGMVVASGLPELGFQVNGEKRAWKEGSVLLFSDAHEHCAWNRSELDRIILLFDIVKSNDLNKKQVVCSRVLAALLLQRIAAKVPILARLPKFVQALFYIQAALFFYLFIPTKNFFGKLWNL
ncbi:MAG: aspartyl/asparaginyl beta-hydroxylase (cupin superfamily) [Parvicellaceae bacterium]|jgi:aspartyl/asparaginyl beta-hydroxylase (cupin superfamily)